tara:strand:- start:95 stop:514 length:420 start_codon:yes stop_codon:yes gene_type:complete
MLNIPEDYEPYKMNCCAGDAVVGILCRRPDGGVSDWHATMNRKAVDGICPISGNPMREVRSGVYVRKTGDITVVMTNSKASRTTRFGTKTAKRTAPKRTVAYKKPSRSPAFPALNKAKPAQPSASIEDRVSKALKEVGL